MVNGGRAAQAVITQTSPAVGGPVPLPRALSLLDDGALAFVVPDGRIRTPIAAGGVRRTVERH